ncbi:delta-latroinsectotoxin-Lt1a-like [Parasteatoda tepidariorum]|uniref:delta-latroinsectotoxin-Lt1a-like n=1 Tax=Parasteatoda tepidariorum TaxID=114398 RepID=UPI0039BC9239
MHVSQMVVALAVAKRDADLDAEFEESMEEIESMKKKCKALEYATHTTGLVTNLIGDIPDIPLVTETVQVVASGVAAVAHVAEYGMNIASTAMECDDWNFEEVKAIMEKRFSEIDRKLDKMTEAMERVTEMATKTYDAVEKTREEMNWGFKNILTTLKNREVLPILKRMNKFSRYFEEMRNELSKLPENQFIFRLTKKDNILDYLKIARKPEGLHSDLLELMDKNYNYAIPTDAKDSKAFQALYALFYGTQTYAAVMFFLLKQHAYLADYYYQDGQDKKFNEQFEIMVATFNEFKTSLTGSHGVINEVVKSVDEVKNKDFIKDVKNELYEDISRRGSILNELKSKITGMELNIIEDTPEPVFDYDFTEPVIPSNYLDWEDKSKIRYAVQFKSTDGTYSRFSQWMEPIKVDGKANPTIKVHRDERERSRLVFRKINDGKPQLIGVLTKSQVEFRDVDRDLYEASRAKDQSKGLECIPKLIEAGAYISARFEMNRCVMHGAAESGNAKIALRYLIDDRIGEILDAKDDNGFTPMHVAASTRNAGFVKFLGDRNADVNAQTAEGLTPLHIAAKNGFYISAQNLLAYERTEINKPEKSGYTPLHYAVRGTAKTIKLLLADERIEVNALSDFGLTPFHLAVMKGNREICDALLSSGKVEVNTGNRDGMTPLHFAALEGNADMIQYLLSGKKEVERVNPNAATPASNWTPLYFAIYFKQKDAALELLKSNNVDISISSKENVSPLQLSIANGITEVFDELLKKNPNLEATSNEGLTALHVAALRPETVFTSKLLDKNVNINSVSKDGSTPLHLASKADKKDQISFLISKGANMKLYDNQNFLPIQYSIKNINLQAMREAISQDPSIVDGHTQEGRDVWMYCLQFIIGAVSHYRRNQDSNEYRKYKDLEPFEVYNKLGYYDLLRIVVNNSSTEAYVQATMDIADRTARVCIEKEKNPDAEPCLLMDVRSKRNIEAVDSKAYLYPKIRPIKETIHNLIETKLSNSSSSFPNAKSSLVQSMDANGILLLVDLLVRKLTNEKYNMKLKAPMSALESQVTALEIVEKVSNFVDSVSDVKAEELIDLAKLHSDVYKSIEGGNSNMILSLLCDQLRSIVDPESLEEFLSDLVSDVPGGQDAFKTVKEYCLSETKSE